MRLFICSLLTTCSLVTTTFAQNVGIGIIEPKNKFEVLGNVLINAPLAITATPPTAGQTITMVNGTTIYTAFGDSTGRIYDPGGPAGNYVSNITGHVGIEDPGASGLALEITLEDVQLGTGDSLILRIGSLTSAVLLAVGNGYTTPGKWIFNTTHLNVYFKSNADANNGRGFSLLYRRLFNNSSLSPDIIGYAGRSLLFEAKTGAFRSGSVGISTRGYNSFASGINNAATADASVALGNDNLASGYSSIAIGSATKSTGTASLATGSLTEALGDYSTAMGRNTTAIGNYSTAMGVGTTASGLSATAMGYLTTASGDFATALGSYVSTNNFEGAFVIGDNSTSTVMNSVNANNFRARFAGGYKLFTSANYATGCTLFAGDNAWTTGSDVRTKENFAEVKGEDFLKKIAGFHLTSWNYKTQDSKTFRHYGPMAQDFYAAFGKDKYGTIGNDTTINSADFAGVSFVAIQALEKRTTEQKKEIDELKVIILQLQKDLKRVEENKNLYNTTKD